MQAVVVVCVKQHGIRYPNVLVLLITPTCCSLQQTLHTMICPYTVALLLSREVNA